MLEEYIQELKPYVIELFNKDSSGHDISHLIRVMNTSTAKCLAEKRIVFMKEFVKEFLNEWNANY